MEVALTQHWCIRVENMSAVVEQAQLAQGNLLITWDKLINQVWWFGIAKNDWSELSHTVGFISSPLTENALTMHCLQLEPWVSNWEHKALK